MNFFDDNNKNISVYNNETVYNCNSLFTLIMSRYVKTIVRIFNLFFSTLCSISFYRIIKNTNSNGQMFKYFFTSSFLQGMGTAIVLSGGFYSIGPFMWQVWYIWFYYFIADFMICMVQILEVIASLDCYLSVNNIGAKFRSNKSFFIFLSITAIVNILLNVDYIFLFEIIDLGDNRFNVKLTPFSETKVHKILNFILGLSRDVFSFFFLIILNSFMLITLRELSIKKKNLLSSDLVSNRIETAQINKIKMILFTSLVFIFCHFPFMVYFLLIHGSNAFWECYFKNCIEILFDASITMRVVIYYSFNKTFKKYFLSTLKLNFE
jgi:hypothetical protein